MKGWYVPASPDETEGESTGWYASYWRFCAAYLKQLRGDDWSLSPEQSITLHVENWTVPKQLLIRATKAGNNLTALPHGTSLLDIQTTALDAIDIVDKNGIRIYALPAALIACSTQVFKQNPTDMRAALSTIRDASEVLDILLEGGHSSIAGRLAGAFRNIGRHQIADEIISTMQAAGYVVREVDPFTSETPLVFSQREQSPYVNRIRLMWQCMRDDVIKTFPEVKGPLASSDSYMKHVEEVYVRDAYHSLSIEGYRVSPELIELVREGDWSPENSVNQKEHLNALAARGYWQASQAVWHSLKRILKGENAGDVIDNDHRIWYREMFAPGVTAGIHKPSDLAGYRNAPVFIRKSMHVPPSRETVRDAMPAFFELMRAEENAAVRTVLGHFIFVYIHPYMDGNGRMGRFLMNAMLASGGYPWTVVPIEKCNEYMAALEAASTNQNIEPFAKFLAALVNSEIKGESASDIPKS
ncbi:MAG: Fic family protein [Pseudomonadales bacterium]|nr:Fic family protein [Pseudomonadales bacterium]